MKSVSILGSGWLGFSIAKNFITNNYLTKASTTSKSNLSKLFLNNIEPYIINIDRLTHNTQDFLKSDVLIINIPTKNIKSFKNLIKEIEKSQIEKVLFVSSTSVYEDTNSTISENDGLESTKSRLFLIENLFLNSNIFTTTIVRFGGLIGANRNPGRFFNNKKLKNPNSFVNLIHIDDCIGIIEQIIKQNIWNEIFNCCANTHPNKKEFYMHVAKLINNPPPELQECDTQKFKIISNKKIKIMLKYKFLHGDLMSLDYKNM